MEQGEGVVDFGGLLTLLLIRLLSRCCPGGDQEVGGLCWRSLLLLLLLATQAPPGPVPDSSVCHSTSTNTCYLALDIGRSSFTKLGMKWEIWNGLSENL